jgi:molecular chaperone DnaK
MRDVQEQLNADDLTDLDLSVSQLQEALYGLNRRLAKERSQDSNPLQGLKNTLGSLKDELFADDDWDDWDRGRGRDPWADSSWGASARSGLGFNGGSAASNGDPSRDDQDRYDQDRYDQDRYDQGRYDQGRYDRDRDDQDRFEQGRYDQDRYDDRDREPVTPRRTSRQDPFDGDPWAEG